MSDNHFTYLHMTPMQLRMLDADDDPCIHEPLPDEEIEIPPGLVPPLHAEEDESVLVSTSHPSYPYGNPYTLSLLPLRPAARSTKKGLRGNPHTRHVHTWTDLALEELLPWEGEEMDANHLAGLEAEAAAAAHAAATAAAAAVEAEQQALRAQEEPEQQQQAEGGAEGEAGQASGQQGASDLDSPSESETVDIRPPVSR